MRGILTARWRLRRKYLTTIAGVAVLATPAVAEIKADAIRIGVLTDMSGIFATAMGPGSVEAAKMAAEEFGNKINGKPIQILNADHQNKPDLASSIARQWFERDGVQAIADGGSSAASLAVQELVRTTNRVFLVSGAGAVELTEKACAPTSVQWTQDAASTANAVVAGVSKKLNGPWFFITADYAFGHAVEASARAKLDKLGIKVAGRVKTPLNTADFSSYLLQAQTAGAKVLALNAAGDNVTAMKQANEFGFPQQGITIVPMSFQNVDIVAAGLEVTKGQLIATSFFEDVTPAARKWSDQFYARRKAMPSQIQAGVLFRRPALPASSPGQRLRRWPDGHGADESHYRVRCLHAEGRDSRRPTHGSRPLYCAGQDAGRVERTVGPRETHRDRAARGSLPTVIREQVPACGPMTTTPHPTLSRLNSTVTT